MNHQYYLVNKKILPPFFETVLKIKEEIEEDGISVSTACENHKLSRSTYYKYKDYIYKPIQNNSTKAIISFRALNTQGVLSNVLNVLASTNSNIITLNQDMPVQDYAFLTITIDVSQANKTLEEIIELIKNLENIKKVELIAFEG